jgi:hypothetical protein
MGLVPSIDAATTTFAFRLATDSDVRMASHVPRPTYPDDLILVTVPNRSENWARPIKCWFNCLSAEEAGLGTAVFGWALWWEEVSADRFIMFAQHHAVLRTGTELVDITPYLDDAGNIATDPHPILFMPDSRVPLDLKTGAFPPCFVFETESRRWGWATRVDRSGCDWLPGYGVLKFGDPNWREELPRSLR